MLPISDPDSLALWLKENPPEWASTIATRIALRVVPILQDALCADEESRRAQIVLPSLIALSAVSISSAKFDESEDVRQVARTAARGATDALDKIYRETQKNVKHGIEAVSDDPLCIHELESDRDSFSVATHAVNAIVYAVQTTSELFDSIAGMAASNDAVLDSVVSTAKEAHWAVDGANDYSEWHSAGECDGEEEIELPYISEFWSAIQRDASYLETGANSANEADEAAISGNLFEYMLWPEDIPVWSSRKWVSFKDAMPPEEQWGKWINWYDACLLGKSSVYGPEMKTIIAVAGREWPKGPAKTNAAIENLIDGDAHSNTGTTDVLENPDYQVALSFAGEQREYVEDVARHLKERSISVFYDEFESTQLWGKHVMNAFHEVYSTRAQCVVMFISSDYVTKYWPQYESEVALSRMLKRKEYILPVRFDDTSVPGLPDTIRYLEANEYTPAELSTEIANKIGMPTFNGKASDMPPPRVTSPFGETKFDYSSYNGRYIIGSGIAEFETRWSKASNSSIHIYNDAASIYGVAIDRNASAIHEVTKASSLDYTSRVQTPITGQVVVLRNRNGFYAAIQILKIKDNTRGDNCDELHFRYAIQRNSTDSFESFRAPL